MKKWLKVSLKVVIIILVIIIAISITYILINSNKFADILIQNPIEERMARYDYNTDIMKYHLDSLLHKHNLTDYKEFWLTTKDSFNLEALYFPSKNGAAILLLHGYKAYRFDNLVLTATSMLVRNGYGVMLAMRRAHGNSDGELITFGKNEYLDTEAAYQYIINSPDVNADKIGLFGQSMGGAMGILYTAENSNIKAVIADSPYDSFDNTLGVSVEYFTGLPAFPFGNIIKFFMERKLGFNLENYDPINSISKISPRPVYIMMGGKDNEVNPTGGQKLVDAAGESCEFWYDSEVEHCQFRYIYPVEFEKRVVGFFDKYLKPNQ